jgi:hypothetical protein
MGPAMRMSLVAACLALVACAPESDGRAGARDLGTSNPDLAKLGPPPPPPADLAIPISVCKSGKYQGTFEGVVNGPLGAATASGDLSLTLAASANEIYQIETGALSGTAVVPGFPGAFPYSAEVKGALDCTALALSGATLENGKVDFYSIKVSFTGELTGTYATATHSLSGGWTAKEPNAIASGMGTWKAAWVSP